ncbi:olfactory receptor 1019-like [Rhinatrema bivittatum]|uniref:olfactory receptor 1019-like n=1 Tax=Rhinatrema bivittatum TaxID=194408 RepID=UPI00112E0BC1|nr:olfactory receptor 1019-like [Rhinatrema bivittatum]
MSIMKSENQTILGEFIILGFYNMPQMKSSFFGLFLMIYIVTITGNATIILITLLDSQLHSPMYFFLRNLSILESLFISVTLPKMLEDMLFKDKGISFLGCAAQMYFFLALGIAECFLLAGMAYDRYVAICNPLYYAIIMNRKRCTIMATFAWVTGILLSTRQTNLMFSLRYCGHNTINHFFCDIPPLLKLACTDTYMVELEISLYSVCVLMTPCLLILVSYICILAQVLWMRSADGRRKAFSTCGAHLTSVTLFYGSTIVAYLLPKSSHSEDSDKMLALFYAVVIPLLNPMIYSLRNKELKAALRRSLTSDFWLPTRLHPMTLIPASEAKRIRVSKQLRNH